MIPKVIHQMWVQGFDSMPDIYKEWSSKWKTTHPNWELKFWSDTEALKFIEENYPHYLEVYKKLIPVKKTDFFRLLLLYHFGGVWVDTDTYPVKSLDMLIDRFGLNNYDMVVSFENDRSCSIWKIEVLKRDENLKKKYEKNPKSLNLVVGSAFLMFKPGQEFLIKFIEDVKNKTDMPVLEHYSTWAWTPYLADYIDSLNIKILLAKHCLMPIETEDTYMVHMYDGTWLNRSKDNPWDVI